jgi:hypothetical protein
MKNFLESTIPMQVGKIMSGRNYAWSDYCTDATFKTLFEGMALYLGRNKSKDIPVAIELRDSNDKFHFGAYVQYIKQDEGDEGSWVLNYTFCETDIDRENWTIAKYPDDQVASGILTDIAYTRYGMIFKFLPKDNNGNICEGSPQELLCTCIDALYDYMRANVTQDPELEYPNYFTATAKLDGDGSVYVGIEPSAIMKQHVKDDSYIDKEKDNAA